MRWNHNRLSPQANIQNLKVLCLQSKIQNALERLFKKHRIVFWYDEEESLPGDFDAISLPVVEKVEIANNEFGLMYRVLRQQPTQKFLVFKSGPQPEDRDNWLLDVQLAHTDFRTDKASLWLTDLELPYEFRPIVNCHEFFFNSAKRRELVDKLDRWSLPGQRHQIDFYKNYVKRVQRIRDSLSQ